MSPASRNLLRILSVSALLVVMAVPASAQYSLGVIGRATPGHNAVAQVNPSLLQVPPPQIFDVAIDLIAGNVWDGIGYIWEYKVTGINGDNKALSHWTLALCPGAARDLDMSFFDFQSPNYYWQSTRADALKGYYKVTPGLDPTTGVDGIKYDYISGPALDADGEMDYFKFRLTNSHDIVDIDWAAKDGNVPLVFGTVGGPSCEPSNPIPEPATLLLLGLGLGGGALARRRRRS